MQSPYNSESKEEMTSSIRVIARAQQLDSPTVDALKAVIEHMNHANPKLRASNIDEAIESAMSFNPMATRDDIFPAYEALFLYLNTKQSLSNAIDDGDVKTILAMISSFGKIQGYKPDKDDNEQKELVITFIDQS